MRSEQKNILRRQTTWEEWEKGRSLRRAVCDRITGGRELRRDEGDPRKDALLRALNEGARGGAFATTAALREVAR